MATAACDEQHRQPLGAGGKFRKTTFRRTNHTTPYDRSRFTTTNGGWISKLINPAQKLLNYSAHRLFSTVFRKRLPPPLPPPPPSSEVNHERGVIDKGEVDIDPPGVQNGAIEQSTGPRATSARDGFTLLEKILEQKTFTRPEIDRLKELLHSRTDDIATENLENRPEVMPSMAMVSQDREEYTKTPWQYKSATVPHEDAASPVRLAKAYMDIRPSRVSPLLPGLHNQAVFEDSHISTSAALVAPRSSSNGAAPDNDFATPRSRGRSAIHRMARTPYSRVQTCSTFKGVGSTVDTYGAPSSSTRSVWEQSQTSGSKQGALKRRFSVLYNDIGSIGPIHRVRPKPNLLPSRGLSSQMSTEAFQDPSSSTKRPLLLGEPKHTLAKASANGDNAVPKTCYSTVPSQSSNAASKIFEHLDKITSPEENSSEPKLLSMSDRSPTKMSPSILHGQALKSLEHVDSSKFLENFSYKNGNSLDVSSNQIITDASAQKHDNVKENCPTRILAPRDNSSKVANEVESTTEKKDVMVKVKPAVSAASNTAVHPPEKKRRFKMSVHEYLELDDDDYSINGHVPGSFDDGRVNVDKIAAANLEKPIASTEVKPPSFALNEKSDSRMSDGVYTIAPGATDIVPEPVHTDKADKNNSDADVPFRVPETIVSSSPALASIFFTTSQVSNNLATQSSLSSMAPTANTNSGNNIAATSAVTTSSSNLFSSVSAPSFSSTSNSLPSEASTVSALTTNSAAGFGMSNGASSTSVFPFSSTSNSLPSEASTVSTPTTNSAAGFGMSNGASSTSVFPFMSFATTAASQPAFGNSNPMGFPTAPSGNNNQMAEDTVHASQPTVAAFDQQSVSAPQSTPMFQFAQQPVSTPQTPFVFGESTNGFLFQSQPNQSNLQNPSPFQPLNNLANSQNPSPFQGSNSLCSGFSFGATDKSNIRIGKGNRSKNWKK